MSSACMTAKKCSICTGVNGNNQATAEYIRMKTNERLSNNENIKRLRKSNNCINKKDSIDYFPCQGTLRFCP